MRRAARAGGRRRLAGAAGDPLDGLVNLFDIGIVLAIAFLIAGLASRVDRRTGRLEPRRPAAPRQPSRPQPARQSRPQQAPSPSTAPPTRGRGRAVGTVYRLDDGRLVYTQRPSSP